MSNARKSQLVARIADAAENVVAIKEFSGDVRRVWQLHHYAPRIEVLVGADDVLLELSTGGVVGWIAGFPNALPKESVELYNLCLAGEYAKAKPIYAAVHNLFNWDSRKEFIVAIKVAMDAVGRLTSALNQMLARIEEAFAVKVVSEDKLRRFVADASHELRTPLTAIRGFSELHRQGAIKGEENTSELIRRIEDESVRMSSLVEDLLLLARLDQSPEMLMEPVDIGKLIKEAVESAKAARPTHEISIELESEDLRGRRPAVVLAEAHSRNAMGVLGGGGRRWC